MVKKIQVLAPEGFCYQTEILQAEEEKALVDHIRALPLKEYEFHGFTARRRVMYYGWQYDSSENRLRQAEQIPEFLQKLRERAASFAGLAAENLALAQVIEL